MLTMKDGDEEGQYKHVFPFGGIFHAGNEVFHKANESNEEWAYYLARATIRDDGALGTDQNFAQTLDISPYELIANGEIQQFPTLIT